MPMFVLFLSAGVLSDGAFTLWVSLIHLKTLRTLYQIATKDIKTTNDVTMLTLNNLIPAGILLKVIVSSVNVNKTNLFIVFGNDSSQFSVWIMITHEDSMIFGFLLIFPLFFLPFFDFESFVLSSATGGVL